ncbi:MAG: hypothetical protein JWR45_162 [Blastococcus sp.]|jgi:uncharacterized protein YlxW (UPF0749 family)|nr:hypothetical protein [Blastococcus sp.]
MTSDRPGTGPPADAADDDVVGPHPFGSADQDSGAAPLESAADATVEPGTGAALPEPRPASAPDPPAEAEPVAEGTPVPGAVGGEPPRTTVTARRRTRDPLAAALIGVLTLLLGFAFAVQVRAVGDDDEKYSSAREEDLVRILDDLNAREERLRDQISDQRSALEQLSNSDSQLSTALEEARARAQAIGILNGTLPARGPGLLMTVRDPKDGIRVADLLDAIQELRGAGAETMQIDGVRVGVSTAVTGDPGRLMIDGRPITAPYDFVVIGSPQDMETAMNIPGGVVPKVNSRGGSVDITPSQEVVVDALRPLDTPQYAEPDTGD